LSEAGNLNIIMMNEYKIFGRIAVLVLAYLMKLTVDRKVDKVMLIKSLLEFPVNLFFVGLSFLVAFSIIEGGGSQVKEVYILLIYLIITPISILTWRRSEDEFEKENLINCGLLFVLNFSICSAMVGFVFYPHLISLF